MTLKKKRAIIFVSGLFTALYFLLVFLYQFRPNKYSSALVYPYFFQDWRLFVPPPESNYNLYATYIDEVGKQTTDVFTEVMNKHQANRLAGNEFLLIALSNTIHYFEKETVPGKITTTAQGTKFSLVKTFAQKYLENTRKMKIDSLKIILVVSSTASGAVKVYYD